MPSDIPHDNTQAPLDAKIEANVMLSISLSPDDASLVAVCGLDEEQLVNVVAATLERVGLAEQAELSALFAGDEEVRALNLEYRERDEPTDVLSFPFQIAPLVEAPSDQLWSLDDDEELQKSIDEELAALDAEGASDQEGAPPNGGADDEDAFEDDDLDDEFGLDLGDIAISYETAARQAAQAGHSLAWETAYLLSHGVLHLVGFDDKTDAGYKAMVAHQEAILAAVGIAK